MVVHESKHSSKANRINDLWLFKELLTASAYDESAWRLESQFPSSIKGWRRRIKGLILSAASSRNKHIVSIRPFNRESRNCGQDWPMFGYTMVGHKRLDNIQYCIEEVLRDTIPGDIIETGVWRGGAMMFAKAVLDLHGDKDRIVWCADSFQGLPTQYGTDAKLAMDPELSGIPYLSVTKEQVEKNFARFGLLDDRVRFLEGWFKDTLPSAPMEKISVMRLDGDLYESTMDALTSLYPRMSNGGFVIIDDYGSWNGCRSAVDSFREKHGIKEPLMPIDQHGYFWRKVR